MRDLLAKIGRRKLVQWLTAYLAGAWLTLEVVDTLGGMWGWPSVVGRVAFVTLAVGLLGVAVVAWYHGERGVQRISAPEVLLLTGLLVVGGFVVANVLRRSVAEAGAPAAAGLPGGDPDPRSLVVLPFVDLSPGGDREYLGEGIAETLINGLARVPALRVVARTSAFQFKETELDVPTIAARLGVGSVLEGTVSQVGDHVRITADLMDGSTGVARWSERFDRETSTADLFALQDSVARHIVDALQVQLRTGEPIVGPGSRSQEAQRAYFLGREYWLRRTTDDMARAAEYFHRAIAADSGYADAWAGLALAYVLHTTAEYGVPGITDREALARTGAAARRAIRLDSASAAAYTALGDMYRQEGRVEEAEESFRKAIELNPGYDTAHHWLADLLMQSLEGEEALREIDIAESLDPAAPAIVAEKAQALMMLGRHPDAEAYLDHAVELLPDSRLLQAWATWFYAILGRWDRAAEHFGRVFEIEGQDPGTVSRVVAELRDPARREALLRIIAEGRFAETGLGSGAGADSMGGVHFRFVATRILDGDDRAMELLEGMAAGPEVATIYVPVLPALLGPELSATPRARRLMERLARRDVGSG